MTAGWYPAPPGCASYPRPETEHPRPPAQIPQDAPGGSSRYPSEGQERTDALSGPCATGGASSNSAPGVASGRQTDTPPAARLDAEDSLAEDSLAEMMRRIRQQRRPRRLTSRDLGAVWPGETATCRPWWNPRGWWSGGER